MFHCMYFCTYLQFPHVFRMSYFLLLNVFLKNRWKNKLMKDTIDLCLHHYFQFAIVHNFMISLLIVFMLEIMVTPMLIETSNNIWKKKVEYRIVLRCNKVHEAQRKHSKLSTYAKKKKTTNVENCSVVTYCRTKTYIKQLPRLQYIPSTNC